jgi:hypothetical protein
MPQYGAGKGLAYINDWEGDLDRLYKRAEYDTQLQVEKERKTAYYGELLKKGHGSNPRTEAELDEYYTGLNKNLADFFTENPNFETDPVAYQKFLGIQDKYLNNDILRQDLQVGQEFEKLKAAYNSKAITEAKFQEEMARYNEYIDPEVKGDPYVFSNPKVKTSNELLAELETTIGKTETDSMLDPRALEYYTETLADPVKTDRAIRAALSDEENRLVMERDYESHLKVHPEDASLFPTIEKFWADKMKNKIGVNKNYIGPAWRERLDIEMDYAKKKASKDGDDLTFTFFTEEMQNLGAIMDEPNDFVSKSAGQLRYADASPAAITLTPLKKYNKLQSVGPSTGARVIMKDGSRKDLRHNLNVTATNVGRYVNINGSLYLETTVSFDQSKVISMKTDSGNVQNSNISDDDLINMGFKSSENTVMPIMSDPGGTERYTSGKRWTGTLLMPVNTTNSMNMIAFEQEAGGGVAHVEKAAPVFSKYAAALANMNQQGKTDVDPLDVGTKAATINPIPPESLYDDTEGINSYMKTNYGKVLDPGTTGGRVNQEYTKKYGFPVLEFMNNGERYLFFTKDKSYYKIGK